MIKIFQEFDTIEQFSTAFNSFCQESKINCSIKDSKYTDETKQFYKYVQFNCVHGGKCD